MSKSTDLINLTDAYSAKNYAPLDVMLERGEGVWVYDVDGNKYLDFLSAYSALNFGHCNKRIEKAAIEQLGKLTLTSRAFYTDELAYLSKELCQLARMDKVLLMNSGAEGIETAIKMSRRWGYRVKGVSPSKAEIIAFSGNFHGRTTTIISLSDSNVSREDFGPYTPGFKIVSYGDAAAFEAAIHDDTVAVIVEPIQGEGGVIIPPAGFLRDMRRICSEKKVLMIADEIQTGLYRTGKLFACDHENVKPDICVVAKSLGGGIIPISAVLSSDAIFDVLTAGSHGSTFGGNPFACRIAREVVAIIREEPWEAHIREREAQFMTALNAIMSRSKLIKAVRGRGLMFGVDIDPAAGKAKKYCLALKEAGLLAKDTREQTIRFAPPLVISREELDLGIKKIAQVLG